MNDVIGLSAICGSLQHALGLGASGAFSWYGEPHGRLPPSTWQSMGAATRTAYTTEILANHLYPHLYCYGRVVLRLDELASEIDAGSHDEALIQANCGGFAPRSEWEIEQIEDDEVLASVAGLSAVFPRSWLTQHDEAESALQLPTAEPRLSPGFFLVRGVTDLTYDRDTYRFYFAASPDGRVALMRYLTQVLNEHSVPFRFKSISTLGQPARADSAVLYVEEESLDTVTRLLSNEYAVWVPEMRDQVPTFAKELAPGVGFAQDPSNGMSFGQSRCRVLAAAWMDWASAQERAPFEQAAASAITRAGYQPQALHLSEGGIDVDSFEVTEARPADARRNHRASDAAASQGPAAPELIEVATWFGDALIEGSFEGDGTRQWLATNVGAAPTEAVVQTLGQDLYQGVAGVAVFLSELAQATGQASVAIAARQAIESALRQAEELPIAMGMFSGTTGVFVAAAAIASTQQDESLELRTIAAVNSYLDQRLVPEQQDLLLGTAGEVMALLRLGRRFGSQRCLAWADELASELVSTARPSDSNGLIWPTSIEQPPAGLAGLTHGGSGIALALIELAQNTSDSAKRRRLDCVIEQAFLGEDDFFRSGPANWRDARRSGPSDRFSYYWCHGLPGIALARAAAYQLGSIDTLPWPLSLTQMTAALRDQVEATAVATAELSLCHGYTGLAEILCRLDISAIPLVSTHLCEIAKDRGPNLEAWPHGRPHGLNPGLLTGHAGIGLAYLRLATGDRRSVLVGEF